MSKKEKILIPLIAIALGLLLGIVILLLSGKDVAGLFMGLLRGATGIDLMKANSTLNLRYPGEFLVSTMPIILTGLSIGFAYRTGMFNIGAEGQVICGALVSCMVAILVPMPAGVGTIVCLLAGGLAGACWAFIPGILKCRFNISEVVTGIMLNYTALYGANFFYKSLPESTVSRTANIPLNASLSSEFLSGITNGSRLNWGFVVVIICVIAYWFILEKTSFGYSLRATGFNKDGARFAGIKVNKSILLSIMISGFLAGIAGAIILQGTFNYGRVMTAMDNYGFDGISVALVGGCNAIGVALAGFLFGLLKVAQPILQSAGIPKEIGDIISSSIVFFVALQFAIQYYLDKMRLHKKKPKKIENKGGAESC